MEASLKDLASQIMKVPAIDGGINLPASFIKRTEKALYREMLSSAHDRLKRKCF